MTRGRGRRVGAGWSRCAPVAQVWPFVEDAFARRRAAVIFVPPKDSGHVETQEHERWEQRQIGEGQLCAAELHVDGHGGGGGGGDGHSEARVKIILRLKV